MAITVAADVAEVIEKVVSSVTTATLIQEAPVLGAVRDFSAMVGPGMDRLDIPLFNELAVQAVDDTGGAMTAQTIDPTAAQLSLSSHRAVPFSIPSKVSIESKINLVQEAVKNGAMSLAWDIDDLLIAEAIANAGTTLAIAAADALVAILGAKAQFDTDNVRKSERFLIASPGFMADLLAVNTVIRANEYGSTNPVQAGFVADVLGFRILESSSSGLPANGFVAMHREALCFARQRMIGFESERKVFEQRDDYALVHKFGLKSSVAANPRIYYYNV